MKDLIDLQAAHVNQYTNYGVKSAWKVEANITNKALHELPSHFSEDDIFKILKFARKFEKIAFESGIGFQKELSMKMYQKKIDQLQHMNKLATEENIRLANKLGQLIGEKE